MGLVYGVGVNDFIGKVSETRSGKQKFYPFYLVWNGMLRRCYSNEYQEKYPTYAGVKVCDEWLSLSAFKVWFDLNFVDGWQIDKDLIVKGDVYSPESCVFVPQWLNSFTIDSGASRGDFPIGVSLEKRTGMFRSSCRNGLGKQEFLGYFSCPEAAHNAWRDRKLEVAEDFKREMDDIDPRIYPRVVEIINSAR